MCRPRFHVNHLNFQLVSVCVSVCVCVCVCVYVGGGGGYEILYCIVHELFQCNYVWGILQKCYSQRPKRQLIIQRYMHMNRKLCDSTHIIDSYACKLNMLFTNNFLFCVQADLPLLPG